MNKVLQDQLKEERESKEKILRTNESLSKVKTQPLSQPDSDPGGNQLSSVRRDPVPSETQIQTLF